MTTTGGRSPCGVGRNRIGRDLPVDSKEAPPSVVLPVKMTDARREELAEKIEGMRAISGRFYAEAARLQVHQFIEITGFLNEYIAICTEAVKAGVDYEETSIHSGGGLPMKEHHAAYIGEKFGCMFSATFSDSPRLLDAFLASAHMAAAQKRGAGRDAPEASMSRRFASDEAGAAFVREKLAGHPSLDRCHLCGGEPGEAHYCKSDLSRIPGT